jgi:hypothetical protein
MLKTIGAVLTVLFFTTLASSTLMAQDHSQNWEDGNIVSVTEVHIKDGMFNAYINDLNNVWRKFLEEQMKDGSVVGYNMYGNTAARAGEPDLYLTVSYANWAAFDRGEEYFDAIREKVMGSEEVMRSAGIKRGELRKIGSEYVLQEIKFAE